MHGFISTHLKKTKMGLCDMLGPYVRDYCNLRYPISRPDPDPTGNGTNATGGRWKCCCIVFTLIVLAAAAIATLALTVVELKTPKLVIAGAMVASLSAGTPQNPSLLATVNADFVVKNPNFGRYNYRSTTLDFFYEGAMVGRVPVPGSSVGRRSTKKISLVAPLDLAGAGAKLSQDLSAGVVRITCSAGMKGRVIGRDRSTNSLKCVMQIVTATQSITNLLCE